MLLPRPPGRCQGRTRGALEATVWVGSCVGSQAPTPEPGCGESRCGSASLGGWCCRGLACLCLGRATEPRQNGAGDAPVLPEQGPRASRWACTLRTRCFCCWRPRGGDPGCLNLPALWLLLLLGRGRNDETCERFLKFPGGCSLLLGQPSAAFPQCGVQNDAFIKKDEVVGLS